MTVSYGHGIAVAPLNFAAAGAALVNGGYLVRPTFLKRSRGEGTPSRQEKCCAPAPATRCAGCMRRNVLEGTGRNAQVKGYRLGGKTGRRTSRSKGDTPRKKVISTFFAAFPMDDPQYLVLIMIDEPKPTEAGAPADRSGVECGAHGARLW